MKIGFACSEYFFTTEKNDAIIPSSAHGGFGFLTRLKAEYLAKMGHEVHVFTFASSIDFDKNDEFAIIRENGVIVHSLPYNVIKHKSNLMTGISILFSRPKGDKFFKNRVVDSGIQILQFEDTPISYLLTDIGRVPKILVFQDPYDYYDVNLLIDSIKDYLNILHGNNKDYVLKGPEEKFPNQWIINFLYKKTYINPMKYVLENTPSLKLYAEADFIAKKVQNMFHLPKPPETLRNPIIMYDKVQEKTRKPSFTWVARWDPQKRPDMILKIAKDLSEYDFYIIGTASKNSKDDYLSVEKKLIEKYSKYPNIHIHGFVDEKTKREYIGRSWALINTSVREGLPMTFLEAMAEGTPIISYVNPDNYTSSFGIKVDYYDVSSFKNAIEKAVKERLYEKISEKEREYIRREHEIGVVMRKHLDIYKNILEESIE